MIVQYEIKENNVGIFYLLRDLSSGTRDETDGYPSCLRHMRFCFGVVW